MWLKREYKDGEVCGVKVSQVGNFQNLSTDLVNQGVSKGWLSLSRGKIVLHGSGGDVFLTILRGPGVYCCTCGEELQEGGTPEVAAVNLKHTASHGPSPDITNPSGYRVDKFFACSVDGGEIDSLSVQEKRDLGDALRQRVVMNLADKHRAKSIPV